MNFQTLLLQESKHSLTITLHRPEHRNSINTQLLTEIHQVLDLAEMNTHCQFIVIEGENDIFCTGMDFHELLQQDISSADNNFFTKYMNLLKRFTTTSKVIISLLDGQVLAGGLGIAAASDLILSTTRTQLSLSEALWGLLPACVIPFLIRRTGFQKAYSLTLTTQTISALEAHRIGLIDELTEHLDASLARLLSRLSRINQETILDLKTYFRKMWLITDEVEATAIAEINRLITKPRVRNNIKNFVDHQKFPWEVETV